MICLKNLQGKRGVKQIHYGFISEIFSAIRDLSAYTPSLHAATLNIPDPSIDTPNTSHFRPRKFSSPFVTFPSLSLDDANDDIRLLFTDSGFGSSTASHVTEKNKLCPK